MVKSISNSFTNFGKRLIHTWMKIQINRAFRPRFQEFFQNHPEYRQPIDRNVEKKHVKLWQVLRKDINLDTLRLSCNLSGQNIPEIVPEEVFASDIQRILCNMQKKIEYLGNKSFYNRWFPGEIFPKVFVHNIEGIFLNSEYQPLSNVKLEETLDNLQYPVVIKPNMDSMGGADVYFPKNKKELEKRMGEGKNYVIQEIIRQHKFFSKYYDKQGINSIRINLYRSVVTNDMCYLNASLRIGRDGGLDNLTAGGLICSIKEDGHLNNYAVDKYGTKYEQHPDTKITFSRDGKIPTFDEMKKLAIRVARDMYLSRLVSLDLCLDQNGQWRVIEINLFDIAIRASQLGGQPFFGQYTNEVIEYCRNNPWWKL